jgi:hypothetical protein
MRCANSIIVFVIAQINFDFCDQLSAYLFLYDFPFIGLRFEAAAWPGLTAIKQIARAHAKCFEALSG